jgi:3-hydroxyacyl-CoA dehydrogenase
MRYAFFAQRATTKIADIPKDTPVRTIQKVGIIGAGTMGSGIAMNFINIGLPVIILETEQAKLDKGITLITANYQSSVKKGKLSPQQMAERLALIETTLDYEVLKDVDLVIEAVFEDLRVKEQNSALY